MQKNITREELTVKGFSEKDILIIDRLLKRSNKKDETYSSIIHELAKRLTRAVFCVLLVLFVLVFQLVKYGHENAISYVIVFLFTICVIYFLTPFKLSLKCFIFLLKNK
ncbi:hypothetical protein DOX53_09075 [Cronobacter malonaticus]|nr:hypothetical protein [Cronobacter malonaticus]EGT4487892.1 hypothetical protein [Cronobacter malonaticus]